jgi:hypothetical protein
MGVLWTNGSASLLTVASNFAAANGLALYGNYRYIAGTYDDNYNALNHAYNWVRGAASASLDLVGASGNACYGYDIALSGLGVLTGGFYNDSGTYRASYWLDDGSSVYTRIIGPAGVESRCYGIAADASDALYCSGYYQVEGSIYSAALWSGDDNALSMKTLPKPDATESAYADDVALGGGAAFVSGTWTSVDNLSMGGYWTVSGASIGRKPLTQPGDSFSIEAIAVRNPSVDTSVHADPTLPTGTTLPAYPSGVTQSGLVAYYPFSNSPADASGNALNGSLNGGPVATADRFGNPISAYSFDGVDDYVSVPDSDALDLYAQEYTPMTWSVWVRPEALEAGETMSILCKNRYFYDSSTGYSHYDWGGYWLKITESSGSINLIADTWGYSSGVTFASVSIPAGQWTNIAVTYDGTDLGLALYVNGALFSTWGLDASYRNAYPLYIGRDNRESGDQNWWRGALDDVRLFNRKLTAAEILALYHEGGWGE